MKTDLDTIDDLSYKYGISHPRVYDIVRNIENKLRLNYFVNNVFNKKKQKHINDSLFQGNNFQETTLRIARYHLYLEKKYSSDDVQQGPSKVTSESNYFK